MFLVSLSQSRLLFVRKSRGLKRKEDDEDEDENEQDKEEEEEEEEGGKRKELTQGKSKTNRYSPRSRTWYWKFNGPNLESM
jgi:hypothetical protein